MNYPELERLIDVVEKLRDPDQGCPWDLKQTHESLIPYLFEESYEFKYAVESKDFDNMKEELGDVLLQVVLHATISQQNKSFGIEEIAKTLADKLIYRHPHVFEEKQEGLSAEDVKERWDELKQKEKGNKKEKVFSEKLLHDTALNSSFKIGKKSGKVNFDWDDYAQVSYKVEEEWQELKEEITPNRPIDKNKVEEELGDLLFSMSQLSRHLDINPEKALRKANKKFIRRFQKMEKLILEKGMDISQMNQEEMDYFWDEVKRMEKSNES